MKNKFIRCLSPITAIVVLALDCAVGYYGYVTAKKLVAGALDKWSIMLGIIELVAIAIAVAVSVEVLKTGVRFGESEMEFTAIDDNNVFAYGDIDHIESNKDTKASLRKNFVDRYSHIIIHQKDGSVVTIDLGLTTQGTLKKIVEEINSRL